MATKADKDFIEWQQRFTKLVEPIHLSLLRFCRGLTADKESARDTANEAILIAYTNFDQIRDPNKLRSYLFSTAVRIARKERLRKKRFICDDEFLMTIESGSSPEMAAEISLLQDALWKLSDSRREVIILFELSGFSIEEIAVIQQSSVSAIKMRLHRGRKQLKQLLGIRPEQPIAVLMGGKLL